MVICIPLSSRCGHVFLPSLSLWTAWRACYSEFPFCSVMHGINPHTWVVSPGCALLAGCRCRPLLCDDMPHDALMWGHGGKHVMQKRQIGEASCWFGHVLMPSLSLWTAWRVCNSELTIPFSHVGVASHKSHHMTSQCIM